MAKFSMDDAVEDEGGVSKRRRTRPEERGESSNSSSRCETREGGCGGEVEISIDTDLLDCSICYDPLHSPLYQCLNGHVACTLCWSKLQQKCHICSLQVMVRNIALEKVLDSIHIKCTYSNLGCRKSVSYSQKQAHEDTCEFGPSPCSIPDCTYNAFTGGWLGHYLNDHKFSHSDFSFNESLTLELNQTDPYFVLIGPDSNLFLLVNEPIDESGRALSLYYIDPPYLGLDVLSYELMVCTGTGTETSSVLLKSKQVGCIKEWKRGEVRSYFLFVPFGFFVSGQMEVHVSIRKRDIVSLQ